VAEWRIQLEPGVWLANGLGDPPRTLVRLRARVFTSKYKALMTLGVVVRGQFGRKFEHAEVLDG
jgi:hypothetical protein